MHRIFLACTAAMILAAAIPQQSAAQPDTLRVMSYNVLYYGFEPGCQGPVADYHNYLKTITDYARPDVLALIKVAGIPATPGGPGYAPYGFADSVLQHVLNVATPGKYAYCALTNAAGSEDQAILFYNTQRLGYAGLAATYAYVNDFNVYKLYYKAPNLAAGGDTVFLYLIPNHTQSGDGNDDIRAAQVNGYVNKLHQLFPIGLPNVVSFGDFNVRKSSEDCYQALVAPADSAFQFHDPPYDPDGPLAYPSNWSAHEDEFPDYLTTSTRQYDSIPNPCGTGGGAKGWYDHFLFSTAIRDNAMQVQYLPHSYRTIGNDGNRLGVSVNEGVNTSAPPEVIEALYQMSNKYPVMATLLLSADTVTAIGASLLMPGAGISNPVQERLYIRLPATLEGQLLSIIISDMAGREAYRQELIGRAEMALPVHFEAGIYQCRISVGAQSVYSGLLQKL